MPPISFGKRLTGMYYLTVMKVITHHSGKWIRLDRKYSWPCHREYEGLEFYRIPWNIKTVLSFLKDSLFLSKYTNSFAWFKCFDMLCADKGLGSRWEIHSSANIVSFVTSTQKPLLLNPLVALFCRTGNRQLFAKFSQKIDVVQWDFSVAVKWAWGKPLKPQNHTSYA